MPTCTGARNGTCLSAAQKSAIATLFSGARTSSASGSTLIYSSFPWDADLATSGRASWKFVNSISTARDPGGLAFIWQGPPASPTGFEGPRLALAGSIDSMLTKLQTTNSVYTESAMAFMSPPRPEQLDTLRSRGAKLMIYHGTSDPIFSSDHSITVWNAWNQTYGGSADKFARLYLVPGMGHCSGGPATDQFDMLSALVNWVEKGQAPDSVLATSRGAGKVGGVNADVPPPGPQTAVGLCVPTRGWRTTRAAGASNSRPASAASKPQRRCHAALSSPRQDGTSAALAGCAHIGVDDAGVNSQLLGRPF